MFTRIPMFQNKGVGAYKPGLDRVKALAEVFGNPQQSIRSIHVAGTNGKGSTSSMLASVLQSHGLKVGLFTSPHLIDFRERIRINGKMIDKDDVVDFIIRYRSLDSDIDPSFFELTTVMALDYFARSNVDVAVIEVGLGGRLDSTNIIKPLVSVITNISLDHTALLGNTLEQIATEKAGIIKQKTPVVIGNADDPAVRSVFENKTRECNSPIVFAKDSPAFTQYFKDGNVIHYHTLDYGIIASDLYGEYQPENVNTALHVLPLLPWKLNNEAIANGFANVCGFTGLQGRWSVASNNPHTITDTGHNEGGWQYLGPRLTKMADEGPLGIVIGFVNDKDISHIIDKLPRKAKYYFTAPSVERARPADSLRDLAAEAGIVGRTFPTVKDAWEAAAHELPAGGTIFVGGSTFVVADFYASL